MQRDNVYTGSTSDVALNNFMTKVYAWMTIGLSLTGIVALLVFHVGLWKMFANPIVYIGFGLVEIALVFYLVRNVMNMDTTRGIFFFLLFSAVNGLTLSLIFAAYTLGSIANVFFITAGTFGLMSAYGFFTKTDLSKWGNILFMGVIGLIIASVVNWFLQSTMLYYLISYAGVAIFMGLTAYDTQKIKNYYYSYGSSGNLSILGALILYIDFINLFIFLLRIFGRRR